VACHSNEDSTCKFSWSDKTANQVLSTDIIRDIWELFAPRNVHLFSCMALGLWHCFLKSVFEGVKAIESSDMLT